MSQSSEQTSSTTRSIPCTWKQLSECKDCSMRGGLMCRFDSKDMVGFLMIFLPFAVTAIAGMIRAGYG